MTVVAMAMAMDGRGIRVNRNANYGFRRAAPKWKQEVHVERKLKDI